jgi:TPR repeat protein
MTVQGVEGRSSMGTSLRKGLLAGGDEMANPLCCYATLLLSVVPVHALADGGDSGRQQERSRYLEAAAAVQHGDYAVAYYFWRPLAEKGDAEAQYALGWMYHNGYGLVIDDQVARAWWEKAAAQGSADAMFALGTLYSVGSDTIPRDYAAAMRLWAEAAAKGNENARFALQELMQRNLPELVIVTFVLRLQYPALMNPLIYEVHQRTWFKMIRFRKAAIRIAERPVTRSSDCYACKGLVIAVASSFRPWLGWAATQLLRGGAGSLQGVHSE